MSKSLDVLITSFMRHLRAANMSPRTIETYGHSCSQFSEFRKARGPEGREVSREEIEAFIEYLLETRSPATASVRYRALQRFFSWAESEGEIESSPMTTMRPPKIPEKLPPVLSTEDLQI